MYVRLCAPSQGVGRPPGGRLSRLCTVHTLQSIEASQERCPETRTNCNWRRVDARFKLTIEVAHVQNFHKSQTKLTCVWCRARQITDTVVCSLVRCRNVACSTCPQLVDRQSTRSLLYSYLRRRVIYIYIYILQDEDMYSTVSWTYRGRTCACAMLWYRR